ncbi:hypothetical protein AJ87_48115 [Rhizobium yanglingense]|nr:hypothetical protein AJ87_48115 [Rhizobium yanglingense]
MNQRPQRSRERSSPTLFIGLNLGRDQTEDGRGWLIEIRKQKRQPPYLPAYPIRLVQNLDAFQLMR